MPIPSWVTFLLEKIGAKLVTPKDSEKNQALNQHSFRQTNFFSKPQNTIIIMQNPTDGKNYLTEVDNIPTEILNNPTTKFIKSDFDESSKKYLKFYNEDDKEFGFILGFLNASNKSILKLSQYVLSLFNKGEHPEAQRMKANISLQYGSYGRKLCNLYTQGYIKSAFNYFEAIIGKEKNVGREEFAKYINESIADFVKNSDYIFFIGATHNIEEIVKAVIKFIDKGEPYIALHSAGNNNITKTQEIMENIKEGHPNIKNYQLRQAQVPVTTSLCPTYSIYFTLKIKPD